MTVIAWRRRGTITRNQRRVHGGHLPGRAGRFLTTRFRPCVRRVAAVGRLSRAEVEHRAHDRRRHEERQGCRGHRRSVLALTRASERKRR